MKSKVIVIVLVVLAGLFLFSASTVCADPCQADFNCDGRVDKLDRKSFKETFKEERGRTDCDPHYMDIPKTGQFLCYDNEGNVIDCAGTGQDGDLQMGRASPDPRFTDNGDGTVTDNLTGLIWLQEIDLLGGMMVGCS